MSKVNSRKRQQEQLSQKTATIFDIIGRAAVPESSWTDKDEFLDVIYWMRQLFAIALGTILGIIPMQGVFGLIMFFGLNTLVVYLYAMVFQKVDEDEYGGLQEILKEGLMTAFAAFLVSWIVLYSALHFV